MRSIQLVFTVITTQLANAPELLTGGTEGLYAVLLTARYEPIHILQ